MLISLASKHSARGKSRNLRDLVLHFVCQSNKTWPLTSISRSWNTPDLGLYIVNMPETRKIYSISNWRFIRMLQLPMKTFLRNNTSALNLMEKKLQNQWFSNGLSSTNRLICQETHPCWALVTSNWANRVKCWPKICMSTRIFCVFPIFNNKLSGTEGRSKHGREGERKKKKVKFACAFARLV